MKFPLALLLTGLMTAQFASAQPVASTPASSSSVKDQWTYSITPYVWALGIRGSLSNSNSSTSQIKLTPGDLLSDIKMAAMIVAEARSNKFGVYLDAMYGDLGKNASVVVGRADLNANVTSKLSMFTLAPSFNLYSSKSTYVDGLIGARYLWLNESTTISDPALGLSFKQTSTQNITAAIAGLKGRWHLGDSNYFVPF